MLVELICFPVYTALGFDQETQSLGTNVTLKMELQLVTLQLKVKSSSDSGHHWFAKKIVKYIDTIFNDFKKLAPIMAFSKEI